VVNVENSRIQPQGRLSLQGSFAFSLLVLRETILLIIIASTHKVLLENYGVKESEISRQELIKIEIIEQSLCKINEGD
jgi:hypothetical protein